MRNSPRRNILQPTSANSSPATWEEKNWERNVVPVESLVATRGKTRFYGDLKSSLGRKQQRVVSSGVDVDRVDEKGNGNMRARDVSGKVVEEGRGGVYGYRYE